jgi:hypothetical protein
MESKLLMHGYQSYRINCFLAPFTPAICDGCRYAAAMYSRLATFELIRSNQQPQSKVEKESGTRPNVLLDSLVQ